MAVIVVRRRERQKVARWPYIPHSDCPIETLDHERKGYDNERGEE